MNEIKLVVMDIDDTLIGNDLVISPANLQAIRQAADAGVTISLASGRMFDSILPFARQLGVSGPLMCCQGAAVMDSDTREVLFHLPIPLPEAREALRFADELGLYCQYYSLDDFFFAAPCEQSRLYNRLAGVTGRAVGAPLWEKLDFAPTKMLIIDEPPRIREAYALARERFGGRLEAAISKVIYLEFNHPGATKGNAVRMMAQRLNIPLEQVMCIGDGLNDISMIRAAGMGVAMGNGAPELKAAADFVTANREDDGVALALERFVFGRNSK